MTLEVGGGGDFDGLDKVELFLKGVKVKPKQDILCVYLFVCERVSGLNF